MSEQTYTRIVQAVVLVVFVLGLMYAIPFAPASAQAAAKPKEDRHVPDCATLAGIAKARCERHERMYEKCHAIRGEAHHQCDREYIVANPLDCSALAGNDSLACEREREAVRACTGTPRSDFFRCVRKLLRSDPRH